MFRFRGKLPLPSILQVNQESRTEEMRTRLLVPRSTQARDAKPLSSDVAGD